MTECGVRNAECGIERHELRDALPNLPGSPGRRGLVSRVRRCLRVPGHHAQRPDEQGVTAIEYSAYEEMVEAEFVRLLTDARARWPEARIAVRHRLGTIPVGEASIAIAAAAPHRAEAFEACRYVIEAVKHRLPVGKKALHGEGRA